MGSTWIVVSGILVVLIALYLYGRRLVNALPDREEALAKFEQQRSQLENDFFQAAAASGSPRGLRWMECDWEELVELALDRKQRRLLAMVGVTIRFEAIEGSDMEGLPAVGNLRNATGLFVYEQGRWHASGKTVFNHNPDEILEQFSEQFERFLPSS